MTSEHMRAKALEGFFVRDAECNPVYCPQAEIHQTKRKYLLLNRPACRKCKCRCTVSGFKEADFGRDELIRATDARRKQDTSNDSSGNPVPDNLPRAISLKGVPAPIAAFQ